MPKKKKKGRVHISDKIIKKELMKQRQAGIAIGAKTMAIAIIDKLKDSDVSEGIAKEIFDFCNIALGYTGNEITTDDKEVDSNEV